MKYIPVVETGLSLTRSACVRKAGGHIDPQFTIGTLETILAADPDVTAPFILVARRMGDKVAIHIRSLQP